MLSFATFGRWPVRLALAGVIALFGSLYLFLRLHHIHPTSLLQTERDDHNPVIPSKNKTGPYTRTVVAAKLSVDDTTWIDDVTREDPNLDSAVYVVDDPSPEFAVPKNKGHEAMVYLTYIIDHYDKLKDVTIFLHAHLQAWHNNDLMDWSSATAVKRLRSERVIREGYMNLRCHHHPGCPEHIHPIVGGDDTFHIPEAKVIGKVWVELLPDVPLPQVLSQPCCSQFAVSADRLRSIPRDKYIFFRNWLLITPLDDQISGRVWEYIWQHLFAGTAVFCPDEHTCYCDGYGICFKDPEEYAHYFEMRDEVSGIHQTLKDMEKENSTDTNSIKDMESKISSLNGAMNTLKKAAFGEDPKA